MSHSGLCRIRYYVAFGVMSFGMYYVVWHYVAFGVMSFGIMLHSALCRFRPYVDRLCVIWRIVAWPNVVRCNVVRPTVGVSIQLVP